MSKQREKKIPLILGKKTQFFLKRKPFFKGFVKGWGKPQSSGPKLPLGADFFNPVFSPKFMGRWGKFFKKPFFFRVPDFKPPFLFIPLGNVLGGHFQF